MQEFHLTKAINKLTLDIVDINDVESGLQEDVVCAACSRKLVAKKGQITHHFAHYAGDTCSQAYETQLHLTAKLYFSRVGKIPHPLTNAWERIQECEWLNVENVRIEQAQDGRRPDLLVDIGQETYWIEIANRHKCESDKIIECRTNSRNVIEIDVSDLPAHEDFADIKFCKVKIQSLNLCNDYLDSIYQSTTERQKQAVRQLEALRKLDKELSHRTIKIEEDEEKLSQRVDRERKSADKQISEILIRKTNAEKNLAELENAVKELERNKVELERELEGVQLRKSEALSIVKKELSEENEIELTRLRKELFSNWGSERKNRESALEKELKKYKSDYLREIESSQDYYQKEVRDDIDARIAKGKRFVESLRREAREKLQEIESLNVDINRVKEIENDHVKAEEELKEKSLLIIQERDRLDAKRKELATETIRVEHKIEKLNLPLNHREEFDMFSLFLSERESVEQKLISKRAELSVLEQEYSDLDSEMTKLVNNRKHEEEELVRFCDYALLQASKFAIEFRSLRSALRARDDIPNSLLEITKLDEMPPRIKKMINQNRNLHITRLNDLAKLEGGIS